ncbi:MAG: hypothetical protein U1E76_13055 [Planctomycetota bacterium]
MERFTIALVAVAAFAWGAPGALAQCNNATLNVPRHSMAVCQSTDDVFAIGGTGAVGVSATVEWLSAVSGIWRQVDDFVEPRTSAAATYVNGVIYVLGGRDSLGVLKSDVQWSHAGPRGKYICNLSSRPEPANLHWNPYVCSLPSPREEHTTVAVGGKIYVMGGVVDEGGGHRILSENFVIDTCTGRCWFASPMPIAVYGHAAAELCGRIYVFGGAPDFSSTTDKIQCYDPAHDAWCVLTVTLPAPYDHGVQRLEALSTGCSIVLSGGLLGHSNACQSPSDAIFQFSPYSDPCSTGGKFISLGSLCIARDNHGSAILPPGSVGCAAGLIAFGGCNGNVVDASTECLP